MAGILGGGQPYIPGLSDFRVAEADAQRRGAHGQSQQMGILKMQEFVDKIEQEKQRRGILNSAAASMPESERNAFMLDPTGHMTRKDNQQFRSAESAAAREARAASEAARREEATARAREAAELRRELQTNQQDFIRSNRQPRQEPAPQIVQTENGPMQVNRGGQAVPITGPDGQPVKPKGTEKALPTSAAQKLMENQQNLRRAEQALALIEGKQTAGFQGVPEAVGDKNATGWKGYLPDAVLQRVDPDGIDTRAAIGDLGSLVIHDRSGAAVTAAEFPRLRPFIPQSTDDPATVKKKLARFVTEYRNTVQEASDFYRESGYKVPSETLRSGVDRRQPQDRRAEPREPSKRVVVDY